MPTEGGHRWVVIGENVRGSWRPTAWTRDKGATRRVDGVHDVHDVHA